MRAISKYAAASCTSVTGVRLRHIDAQKSDHTCYQRYFPSPAAHAGACQDTTASGLRPTRAGRDVTVAGMHILLPASDAGVICIAVLQIMTTLKSAISTSDCLRQWRWDG